MSHLGNQSLNKMMFEYHEGTLSAEKNMELLDFLNNHPEYNSEFVSWSQTYALRHLEQQEYGLEKILVRKTFPTKRLYWIIGLSCISILLTFLFLNKSEDRKNSIAKPTMIKKNSPEKILPNSSRTNTSPTSPKVKKLQPKATVNSPEVVTPSAEIVPEELTEKTEFFDSISTIATEKAATVQPLVSDKSTSTSVRKPQQVKKSKGRLRLKNTPGDIIKMNPNF